jgi:hypothetical protein
MNDLIVILMLKLQETVKQNIQDEHNNIKTPQIKNLRRH